MALMSYIEGADSTVGGRSEGPDYGALSATPEWCTLIGHAISAGSVPSGLTPAFGLAAIYVPGN